MHSAAPRETGRVPLPRWVVPLLSLAAAGLLPWTLWLTYSLPSRHVTPHYDLAWVGFDVALLTSFAGTAWCAVRSSQYLVPAAAATATMLLCDAWFDVVTSGSSGERLEAVLQALLAELPLSAICWYVVYDAEHFHHATLRGYSAAMQKMRSGED
jgi:hypothetical protein